MSGSITQIQRFSIMSKQNGKASWDVRTTKVFIGLCIEEVEKGGRKGTSLTKPAWASLGDSFTAKTRRVYTKIQFKNKLDSLRKEWQLWDKLLRETATTGPQSWAPSSTTLPSKGVPEDDMEEGSGDSDEILGAPTSISGEFNSHEHEEISEAHARKLEEEAHAYETSITGVMEHLNEVDEVVDDPDMFGQCTTLLMDKPGPKEMYVALKNKREKLLIFLKHATKD
ncbi:uncharacterized protein LOC114759138 [Neltuma alba]|uniref:uncharacterized protein LOC114759138 n=1 Tax=Neltuma alba TaxID=207710 RepID=UPI0010A3E26B|nr:uncharacterized protein LOC114759138 [Prosopis alba]